MNKSNLLRSKSLFAFLSPDPRLDHHKILLEIGEIDVDEKNGIATIIIRDSHGNIQWLDTLATGIVSMDDILVELLWIAKEMSGIVAMYDSEMHNAFERYCAAFELLIPEAA